MSIDRESLRILSDALHEPMVDREGQEPIWTLSYENWAGETTLEEELASLGGFSFRRDPLTRARYVPGLKTNGAPVHGPRSQK